MLSGLISGSGFVGGQGKVMLWRSLLCVGVAVAVEGPVFLALGDALGAACARIRRIVIVVMGGRLRPDACTARRENMILLLSFLRITGILVL